MIKLIRSAVWAAVAVAPLLLAGFAAGNVEEGKAAFQKRCRMCHGADGEGNPAMARMLKVEFHAMDSEHVQKLSDEDLKNTVLKGKGKMAAVRGVDDNEIAKIIAYIRSLKEK